MATEINKFSACPICKTKGAINMNIQNTLGGVKVTISACVNCGSKYDAKDIEKLLTLK